jgi:hypothetical protein
MPHYPNYPSQPYTGDLPSMVAVGPSDTRYTSDLAPSQQVPFDRRYGRRLAGTDFDVQDESSDPGYALNELNQLADMDDVQGNGVFDPPGTHPNIHPDAGVFAARFSLPGYHAREVPFSQTEIVDQTTGRRVVAVPSGAVSLDSAAQIAFIEQGRYKTPQNVVRWQEAAPMPGVSISDWMQNPQGINAEAAPAVNGFRGWGGLGDAPAPIPSSTAATVGKVIVVGVAAGCLWALFGKKKRK